MDMRVPGASLISCGWKPGGRVSLRRRTFLFRILRSALTDLKKRTRISMVDRSLGLQSSILRSGRRFFRCLCELRCLHPVTGQSSVSAKTRWKGGGASIPFSEEGSRTLDQTSHP